VQKAGFFLPRRFLTKTPFTKAAATPEQLLQKLKQRGLVVPAAVEPLALSYLRGVGGYRLKGYWFDVVDPTTKQFPPGYTFELIAERCEFDREVRAATIEAIDRLEVAIRSAMANHLSLAHSPHWFLETAIFKPTRDWGVGQLIRKIEEEVRRSEGKRFVAHYFDHHDEPYLPPSWSISECVTFGLWSRTYSILRDARDKKAISKRFGVDQVEVFQSWIHVLTVVRNVAAHHGQLLKVKLGVAPANYKTAGVKFANQKSFYAAATVVQFLLQQTGLPQRWKTDLADIFARHPSVNIADLGFPPNWASTPGW
jgi:abortive infection bacteriophage resistance protein